MVDTLSIAPPNGDGLPEREPEKGKTGSAESVEYFKSVVTTFHTKQ